MKILENQILYQCDYCEKRFITKQGVKQHEESYCYLSPIPKQKRNKEVMQCLHVWDTHYDYIPGEAVMEPQYYYCTKCGASEMEVEELLNA